MQKPYLKKFPPRLVPTRTSKMNTETKAISVVLPLSLYEKLQTIIATNHRTMAEQIRYWIDAAQVDETE